MSRVNLASKLHVIVSDMTIACGIMFNSVTVWLIVNV